MLSKNFLFTALFFGLLVICISCLENKEEPHQPLAYTTAPTDSSGFDISLNGIQTIKDTDFYLEGKWKLLNDSVPSSSMFFIFEGRKIYTTTDYDLILENKYKNKIEGYKIFAYYDKCPEENGKYDKKGNFLVVGSGEEPLICYKIIHSSSQNLTLFEVAKGIELKFEKILK